MKRNVGTMIPGIFLVGKRIKGEKQWWVQRWTYGESVINGRWRLWILKNILQFGPHPTQSNNHHKTTRASWTRPIPIFLTLMGTVQKNRRNLQSPHVSCQYPPQSPPVRLPQHGQTTPPMSLPFFFFLSPFVFQWVHTHWPIYCVLSIYPLESLSNLSPASNVSWAGQALYLIYWAIVSHKELKTP